MEKIARPISGRGRGAWLPALVLFGLLLAGAPAGARAALTAIRVSPEHPAECDSAVVLTVLGNLPDPCFHVLRVDREGPTELPTMGPIPAFEIKIRIWVQEPNPLVDVACPTVIQPYQEQAIFGGLGFGRYLVNATEYVVPFSPDSSAAPKDSSSLTASFDVRSGCPPGLGCTMLSFGPAPPLLRAPADPCDARAGPGGTACFGVDLFNESRVGGVQTEVVVNAPEPDSNQPSPYFTPTSVEAVGRAAGFTVAWTADGPRAKILLFSPTGAAIEPGSGPILRVCYSVSTDTPEGRYTLRHQNAIISDPAGNAIPPCPTFAEIVGTLCVSKTGCDLNGDGVSNIQDIMLLVHCALAYPGGGGSGDCPDSVAAKADCNLDGKLDVRDVLCCIRRILDAGFGTGSGSVPWTPGMTRIGFTDAPRWVAPTTGHFSVEVEPGVGFGGIQFAISQTGAARIRGLSLSGGSGPVGNYSMEWSDADGEIRAMIYRTDLAPSGAGSGAPGVVVPPLRVDATFEPIAGASGATTFALSGVASATEAGGSSSAFIESGTASISSNPVTAPAVFAPAPNPFTAETAIAYTLPVATRVTIRVYDVSGRLVRTLTDATVSAGPHSASWDGRDSSGRDMGSGIYFFKFAAGSVEKTNRLLKLR